jgi:hypothetical protein
MTRLGKDKCDLSSRCRGKKTTEDISYALYLVEASAVPKLYKTRLHQRTG